MSVGSSGVFVGKLAMFVSRRCVLLGFFVLAERMVMLGLNDDAHAPDALLSVPSLLTPHSRLNRQSPWKLGFAGWGRY
jgi:hypothetical protein